MKPSLALPLLLLTMVGCGSETETEGVTSSDALATADLTFSVRAESNGAEVLLALTIAGPGHVSVTLGGGDQLLVSAEDAAEHPFSAMGTYEYIALLPTSKDRVRLTLQRASGPVSADIDFPPSFTLTVPAAASAASVIPLSWEAAPAGGAMKLYVWGPCLTLLSRDLLTDTGSYELQPGDLTSNGGTCQASFMLDRPGGSAPLGMGETSSAVTAAQVRTAAVEVSP